MRLPDFYLIWQFLSQEAFMFSQTTCFWEFSGVFAERPCMLPAAGFSFLSNIKEKDDDEEKAGKE